MALFGLFGKGKSAPKKEPKESKPKRTRTKPTPDSELGLWLKKLRTSNDPNYDAVMVEMAEKKLGIKLKPKESSILEQIQEFQALREALGGGSSNDDLKDLLKAVAPALVAGFVAGRAPPNAPSATTFKPSPEPVESSPPPVVQQAPALPAPAPEPTQPQSLPAPQEAAMPVDAFSADDPEISRKLVAAFTGQPPEALAEFLSRQDNPDIQRLVGFLKITNDSGARNILETVARDNVHLAPFISWLLEPERTDWLSHALAALRAG